MTELPSQPGPEPEPDAAIQNPSRTEQEPTRPMPDGPGLEPSPMRAGTGQDVFESDVLSAAARYTADWVRSRTHDRASNRARAGPEPTTDSPVLLGRVRTAVGQEATSKDEGPGPNGPARWARTRMDSK